MTRTHWQSAAGVCVLTALGLAQAAAAGTATVSIGSDSTTLVYRAASGERNGVSIAPEDPARFPGTYLMSDVAGPQAGSGCEPFSGNPSQTVRCSLPEGLRHQASVHLGNRNDGPISEQQPA